MVVANSVRRSWWWHYTANRVTDGLSFREQWATVNRTITEFFLNSQQLVVLGHAVAA